MDEDLLAGRYRRRRSLGRGGMGEVWLAEDLLLGRQVAIKRLRFDLDDSDPVAVERVIREARMAARLHHPAAVTTFDLIMESGRPHVVMEYVEGDTLAELIRRRGRIDPFEAAQLIREVAQVLAVAHRSGIVHRDIKPANIIINSAHHPKLADFGIARGGDDRSLTGTGQLIGTVAFMAPEVAGTGVASAASDIWSLGATLYAAVEGHAPYDIDGQQHVLAILTRIATQPVPEPLLAGPLTPILIRMLASEPELRPSADTVAFELSQVLAEQESALGLASAPEAAVDKSDGELVVSDDAVGEALQTHPRVRQPAPVAGAADPTLEPPTISSAKVDGSGAEPAMNQGPAATVSRVTEQPIRQEPLPTSDPTSPARQNRNWWLIATAGSVGAILAAVVTVLVVRHPHHSAARLAASNTSSSSKPPTKAAASTSGVVRPTAVPAILGPIANILSPLGIALTRDGRNLFVTDANDSAVTEISTATRSILATVKVGVLPQGAVLLPDDSRLYVCNGGGGDSVSVIATGSGSVIKTIVVSKGSDNSGGPCAIAMAPDGKHVYVIGYGGDDLTVISTATNSIVARAPLTSHPSAVAVSPNSKYIYLTSAVDSKVLVITASTLAESAVIPVAARPVALIVTADGRKVYVAHKDGAEISVITTATNSVQATIQIVTPPNSVDPYVGAWPNALALSPDGRWLYSVGVEGNWFVKIATSTNAIAARVAGKSVVGIVASPDGAQVFVANLEADMMTTLLS